MGIKEDRLLLGVGRKHPLAYTKFIPETTVKKTLLISSATGVPQEFYRKFAAYFAENSIAAYTFDYSGIGRSGSSKGDLKSHRGGVKGWGSIDQMKMVELRLKEYPNLKINLVTHSIGGQILGFNTLNDKFDKVVMAASQNAAWHNYKGFPRVKIYLFFNFFIPLLTPLFGYYPGSKIGIFENLPGSMAMEWYKWGQKKDYLMHFNQENDHYFQQLRANVRSYSFANDWLASKKGVDWLSQQFGNANIERIHYEGKVKGQEPKHFGFFKENFKTVFWKPTVEWLLQ